MRVVNDAFQDGICVGLRTEFLALVVDRYVRLEAVAAIEGRYNKNVVETNAGATERMQELFTIGRRKVFEGSLTNAIHDLRRARQRTRLEIQVGRFLPS